MVDESRAPTSALLSPTPDQVSTFISPLLLNAKELSLVNNDNQTIASSLISMLKPEMH